jgi:hypothetical protein
LLGLEEAERFRVVGCREICSGLDTSYAGVPFEYLRYGDHTRTVL